MVFIDSIRFSNAIRKCIFYCFIDGSICFVGADKRVQREVSEVYGSM